MLRRRGGAQARGAPLDQAARHTTTSSTRATTAGAIRFGDVEQGFAAADHVFEWRYQSAPIEHAPTETTGCIVEPAGATAA